MELAKTVALSFHIVKRLRAVGAVRICALTGATCGAFVASRRLGGHAILRRVGEIPKGDICSFVVSTWTRGRPSLGWVEISELINRSLQQNASSTP